MLPSYLFGSLITLVVFETRPYAMQRALDEGNFSIMSTMLINKIFIVDKIFTVELKTTLPQPFPASLKIMNVFPN